MVGIIPTGFLRVFMKIGILVREAEIDPNWQMYPGAIGEIIASADSEWELPEDGKFWWVRFDEEDMIFLDEDLVIA
jgi:hypothetical protein